MDAARRFAAVLAAFAVICWAGVIAEDCPDPRAPWIPLSGEYDEIVHSGGVCNLVGATVSGSFMSENQQGQIIMQQGTTIDGNVEIFGFKGPLWIFDTTVNGNLILEETNARAYYQVQNYVHRSTINGNVECGGSGQFRGCCNTIDGDSEGVCEGLGQCYNEWACLYGQNYQG